jgi:hypothetical protein
MRKSIRKTVHQDTLCEDLQATKKYEVICKGYGDYRTDVKDECKIRMENGMVMDTSSITVS